jgi:hypothetical protein
MGAPIFIAGSVYSFSHINFDFFNILRWESEYRGWYAIWFWVCLPVVCMFSAASLIQEEANDNHELESYDR